MLITHDATRDKMLISWIEFGSTVRALHYFETKMKYSIQTSAFGLYDGIGNTATRDWEESALVPLLERSSVKLARTRAIAIFQRPMASNRLLKYQKVRGTCTDCPPSRSRFVQ